MATDIRVIGVREFLRATVHGVFDLESSKQLLHDIAGASPPSQSIDIMIDIREAPANLSLVQISELAAEFHRLHIGAGRKTAVLTEQGRFDNAHFFAITARGKGRTVQAFASFEEAFDWLTLEEASSATQP
jgi:hypothetical protein